MKYRPYIELVRQQFTFLSQQYDFDGPNQFSDDNDLQGYGYYVLIKYFSAGSIATIERERTDMLSVRIGPFEGKAYNVGWIAEFLTDGKASIQIEPYIPVSALEKGWITGEFWEAEKAYRAGADTEHLANKAIAREIARQEAWQEYRLGIYASSMKQYCEPILRGNFSRWIELEEYVHEKIRDEFRARTGKELKG
jgi:hypothetical protein